MDIARKELNRILNRVNPYAWSIEQQKGLDQHEYYFLDLDGTNQYGDTALHRLLALHATPASIENFCGHMMEHSLYCRRQRTNINCSRTMDIDSPYDDLKTKPLYVDAVNHSGVTALHVAVHRNSFHVDQVVRILLQKCPRLAVIPMKCGSFPLHIVVGHTVTIPEGVLKILLHAAPGVALAEDARGDNSLSLLWKNVLRFRWARLWEIYGQAPTFEKSHDLSWMTIVSPEQYRDYSLQLVQAACGTRQLSWHDVTRIPRCPPMLIRLFLNEPELLSGGFLEPDEDGCLPLHYASGALPVTSDFVPDEVSDQLVSTLDLILAQAPDAAAVADHMGRYPLHYAFDHPPVDASIVNLIHANQTALTVKDPLGCLYPIQQFATQCQSDSLMELDLLYRIARMYPNFVQWK